MVFPIRPQAGAEVSAESVRTGLMCDTVFRELRSHSFVGWGLLSWFGLVVAVGVDGQHPDQGVAVVDVDEVFDFDHSHLGSGVAAADLNQFASDPEVA